MAASRERSALPPSVTEADSNGSARTAGEERRAEERRPAEIAGSSAPPAVRAAGDARLLRSCFDGLARDLDHALRAAASPSEEHDAIASCLLVANALCDWPDSDAARPREAFGFRVLRSMPCDTESLRLRGKPRGSGAEREVRGERRASTRRATYNPFNGFCGTKASSQNSVIATAPPSLCPLLPACLRAPFRTELLVASTKFDRNPKKRRSEGGMVPRQVSQEEAEQLHALKAHRFYLLLNHPLAHRRLAAHSKPLRPKYWQPLSLALISSSDPSHAPRPHSAPLASPSPTSPHVPAALPAPTTAPAPATAPPPPVTSARELYSHVKAYLAGRAGGSGSGGDGSGEGSGEEEAQAMWRVVRACGVESVGELSGVVDERGWTPMHVAARNGDSPVLQALLRMRMRAGVCSTRNATTPLHLAAYGGHVGCMGLLVEYGADIRARTAGGWTPLHNAAKKEQWEAVRWLAQQGIDPAEVERPGANPKADRLDEHLMARAVQIVREEHERHAGHEGREGLGWEEEAGAGASWMEFLLDDHHDGA
ncbi:unnamed protein product [Closterium sp. Naga37s-1]|nr:unnamed protein product [Closterium sp. Naga37s-1]